MANATKLSIMALAIGLSLLALVYFLGVGGRDIPSAQQGSSEQAVRLANIAGSCESTVGPDGYGTFAVGRPVLVSDEEGEINVPCKIKLERGGKLHLKNVTLESKNLVVSDYGPNDESTLRIEGSTLTGVGRTALLVQLSDASDSISINSSTLDYPAAVWARALGPVEGGGRDGGRIDVTASTIRSLDPGTDGVQLAVGANSGVGNFVDVQLETVRLDPDLDQRAKKALLVAGQCRMERVTGYGESACDPEDAVRQEQQ